MERSSVKSAIREVFALIDKVAKTDANVVILGENGTGKELIARAIHQRSLRKDNSFVSVDMGAITETLFESELFGHKKGAFTDAREDRPGRFELANGGTLFLDEIGNLSLSLQSKLLSALQSRQVTRVGSNQQTRRHPIDLRDQYAVARRWCRKGRSGRICFIVSIPLRSTCHPLCERVEDIHLCWPTLPALLRPQISQAW